MEIIILILLLIFIGIFYIVSQKNCKIKNTAVKKEEIITQYKNDLEKLLKKYEGDRSKQVEQKKLFLQKTNSELSRNIFFTHEESVKIIERLLKI